MGTEMDLAARVELVAEVDLTARKGPTARMDPTVQLDISSVKFKMRHENYTSDRPMQPGQDNVQCIPFEIV